MFPELEKYLRELGHKAKSLSKAEAAAFYDENAVLTGGSILFHTGNNDKDDNTRLRALFVKKDLKSATADTGQIYGKYEDGSEHLVSLHADFNLMLKSEIAGSVVRVGIGPDGDDTWVFEQTPVTLYFSDGTVHQKTFEYATLTQDTPERDFPL